MLANITEALRQGDHAAALKAARAAVADQPENASAQHLLGVCLQRSGDFAGARAAFERAVALSPDEASFHFSQASLALAQGDAATARASLDQSLALDPNQLGAYVLLIHMALGQSDLAGAERNLKLAQRVNADHPQVLVAEGYVAQARGDGDLAIRRFTAAAAADPSLAAAQLALGMGYLARGNWAFAEQALSNALALDPSRPPNTLRALAESRRRQGKAEQTLAVLDELLVLQPADPVARSLRAEILAISGRGDEALADLDSLLERQPAHSATLRQAIALLMNQGRADEALARLEAALAQAPENDELWLLRLDLSGRLQEDAKTLLDRWQDRNPDSLACLEMLAGYHQARGDDALAEAYADRALALQPLLYSTGLVKVQAEMRQDPALALARIDRMLAEAVEPGARRDLQGWAGMALDALGRHDQAAERWRAMLAQVPPGLIPPPQLLGAGQAPAGEITGTLLWSPPGLRAEYLLRTAKGQLGPRLRLDRIGTTADGDGFGLVRFLPGSEKAGTAARWQQSLQSLGLDPATTVDWLPHLDAYTLAALGGARVVALVTDPRDAFLNWMIHGSLHNYLVSPEPQHAADWLAGSLEAVLDHRDAHPDKVVVATLDRDAGQAATAIEQALGLAEPLPALFGTGARFPTGHWRHYRGAFRTEFDRLTAAAVRLGYPAE